MLEYIVGKIAELTPAYVVVDNNNLGYLIHISLNSYTNLNGKENCTLYLHQVIREDAHLLFGFTSRQERELFRLLISVSGVGPNTARMMLSSSSPEDIQKAISTANIVLLKGIKGIGQKTAERIIVDLRDKINKASTFDENFTGSHNTNKDEALSALIMLGFARNNSEKAIDKLLLENPSLTAEDIVKKALKLL